MLNKEDKVRIIKFWAVISIILIVIITSAIIMLKYFVEGEKNLPYELSKITIISTAEGIDNELEETKNKWDFKIVQINDIYISIDKNEKIAKNKLLSRVIIENIEIVLPPKIGDVKTYMPNSLDGRIYNYSPEYEVTEKLEYRGANKSNSRTLEIGNQGGTALISFVNSGIGEYVSEEAIEIKHDGTLISQVLFDEEQLKFKVKFDLIIEVDKVKYRGNVELDLPCGDIIKNGTATLEITDLYNVIFKRDF